MVQLMDWIRAGEPVSGLQYVVRQLEQVPERRANVVALLSAFWRDIDVAALLADFGFTARSSFMQELGERVRSRMLPLSPATSDLATLFSLLFDDPDDARWLGQLDDAMLVDLSGLLHPAFAGVSLSPLGWREPFYDAIMFLSSQVRAAGFSREMRARMGMRVDQDFDPDESNAERPDQASARQAFRQLALVAERVHDLALAAVNAPDPEAALAALLREGQYFRALLDTCAKGALSVHDHLEAYGVSIDIVFQIDQLTERCRRIEQLLSCVLSPTPAPDVHALMVDLVRVSVSRRSVRALFTQHYSMLARKVAERSAETGEHYITRTGAEYATMFWRAAGGGAVLAITTFLKFAILALGLSPFWSGLTAGGNYAVSFVIVQLLHWTVATKQPAMTAPAMAAKLADTRSDEAVEGFVDEVAHLIRSQMAGILGNLLLVAPVVLAIQGLAWWLLKRPLIDVHTAHHVLDTLTLWGPSLWYAAFTGVLLFASSLFAGWLENWFVLNKLDSALRWNPRIRAAFGAERAQRWALWWRQNISGLGSNMSLGLLLGLVPVVAGFFAAPLDVRHVTLSTGQLAAALGTLGPQLLHDPKFWWCFAALPLTGLLNVGVSFGLALRVAMRSRGVRVKDRARLQAALRRRLRQRPLSFLLPPRSPSH
ncbi:MAG: recombinase [Burkholderiales bacterium]|nr:recombinase [Burkholderiales bacterium]